MKNKVFFVVSFFVFAAVTFVTSKTKASDKPVDCVLIGLMGASATTLVFNAVSKAMEEEDYIDNNPTQFFDKTNKEVTNPKKYLDLANKAHKVPNNSEDSTLFEDVTETGFFAERKPEIPQDSKKIY